MASHLRGHVALSAGHLGDALTHFGEELRSDLAGGHPFDEAEALMEIASVAQHSNWAPSSVEQALTIGGPAFATLPQDVRGLVLDIGMGLASAHGPDVAERFLPGMAAALGGDADGSLRPFRLTLDALRRGDERALARQPEEMRRVVRFLLEIIAQRQAERTGVSSSETTQTPVRGQHPASA